MFAHSPCTPSMLSAETGSDSACTGGAAWMLRDIRGNKGQQQELVALDGPEASAATDSVD